MQLFTGPMHGMEPKVSKCFSNGIWGTGAQRGAMMDGVEVTIIFLDLLDALAGIP